MHARQNVHPHGPVQNSDNFFSSVQIEHACVEYWRARAGAPGAKLTLQIIAIHTKTRQTINYNKLRKRFLFLFTVYTVTHTHTHRSRG